VVPAFSSRSFGAFSASEIGGLASNLLLRNYIVDSDAFGGGAVNGSLWSIPYEFWCYLGVMALGLTPLLRWRLAYLLIAVAVMAVRVWLDMTGRRPGGGLVGTIIGFPYFWFNVLPPFLLGSAVYLYRNQVPRSVLLLVLLIAATIGAAHLPLSDVLRTAVTRLLLPPTLTYMIFYVAFSPVLRAHDAARYGDFSYGTYLYAFPIQQMLVTLLKDRVSFAAYVILSLIASLLAGMASWHLVEKWFLPRLRGAGARATIGRPLEEEAAIVAP
jgi:peptidoglycan/LPS O-acetylase OafA/YrhL